MHVPNDKLKNTVNYPLGILGKILRPIPQYVQHLVSTMQIYAQNALLIFT